MIVGFCPSLECPLGRACFGGQHSALSGWWMLQARLTSLPARCGACLLGLRHLLRVRTTVTATLKIGATPHRRLVICATSPFDLVPSCLEPMLCQPLDLIGIPLQHPPSQSGGRQAKACDLAGLAAPTLPPAFLNERSCSIFSQRLSHARSTTNPMIRPVATKLKRGALFRDSQAERGESAAVWLVHQTFPFATWSVVCNELSYERCNALRRTRA